MNVKAPSTETRIESLSGGNQQKVLLARWLISDPKVMLLDEPTRGIDVGSKVEIYKIMTDLARQGRAILMISSELPELIGMCDRIYVMSAGRAHRGADAGAVLPGNHSQVRHEPGRGGMTMLSKLKSIDASRYSIFIILGLVFLAASLLSENFLSVDNQLNVLRQVAVITILAYGAMILIIGGMIDLSAGAVMAFAGVTSVMVYKDTGSLLLAVLAGIAIGVSCNLVNAFLVATLNTPAFIVTLGMMLMARGAVLQLTQGQNVLQLGDFVLIGQGTLGWAPIPALILRGHHGRHLVPDEPDPLRPSCLRGRRQRGSGARGGHRRRRIKYKAFVVNGVLVGLAGVIFMSRVNAGLPNAGVGYELQAITAPIIGGTSFSGGVGTTVGTLAGALIVGRARQPDEPHRRRLLHPADRHGTDHRRRRRLRRVQQARQGRAPPSCKVRQHGPPQGSGRDRGAASPHPRPSASSSGA